MLSLKPWYLSNLGKHPNTIPPNTEAGGKVADMVVRALAEGALVEGALVEGALAVNTGANSQEEGGLRGTNHQGPQNR